MSSLGFGVIQKVFDGVVRLLHWIIFYMICFQDLYTFEFSMVFEYESNEAFKACEEIITREFGEKRKDQMSKFVFKILNNRGVVVSEFVR